MINAKIIKFAIDAHNKVNHYYDGCSYSLHLSIVSLISEKFIIIIPEDKRHIVRDACWLHDTIEDCRLTYNDIKNVAGKEVADIVYAVTNEKGKNRSERANAKYYEGIRAVDYAIFVKLCDRIANIIYSYQTDSPMVEVYRKESDKFLEQLFPDKEYGIYNLLKIHYKLRVDGYIR